MHKQHRTYRWYRHRCHEKTQHKPDHNKRGVAEPQIPVRDKFTTIEVPKLLLTSTPSTSIEYAGTDPAQTLCLWLRETKNGSAPLLADSYEAIMNAKCNGSPISLLATSTSRCTNEAMHSVPSYPETLAIPEMRHALKNTSLFPSLAMHAAHRSS